MFGVHSTTNTVGMAQIAVNRTPQNYVPQRSWGQLRARSLVAVHLRGQEQSIECSGPPNKRCESSTTKLLTTFAFIKLGLLPDSAHRALLSSLHQHLGFFHLLWKPQKLLGAQVKSESGLEKTGIYASATRKANTVSPQIIVCFAPSSTAKFQNNLITVGGFFVLCRATWLIFNCFY